MRIDVDFEGMDLAAALRALGAPEEAWNERDPRLVPWVVGRSQPTTIEVLEGTARLLLFDALPALPPHPREAIRVGSSSRFASHATRTARGARPQPLHGRTAVLGAGDVVVIEAGERFGLAAADERTVLRLDPPLARCR